MAAAARRGDRVAVLTEELVKAVILAGGYGSRISEETNLKPKPMVEIGGMPSGPRFVVGRAHQGGRADE